MYPKVLSDRSRTYGTPPMIMSHICVQASRLTPHNPGLIKWTPALQKMYPDHIVSCVSYVCRDTGR